MTATSTPTAETITVDDPDGKKFYELTDHDAMTLDVADVLVRNGGLRVVKDVKKKRTRGGLDWTVTLSDGFKFDPRDDMIRGVSDDARRITYWRPRRGF